MRRRHRRLTQSDADLDITPFMNLMIVLVPILLLSMVFSQSAVLELRFSDGTQVPPVENPEELRLHVILQGNYLELGDNQRGLIRRFPPVDDAPDFEALGKLLRQVKAQVPDKRDIALLTSPGTRYQELITAMDTLRSYPEVVAASLVQAELFPDIALGDAPVRDAEPEPEGADS